MSLELQDMRDALKGQAKADEAIFWFCNAWHSGKQSDLYKIMVATGFTPDYRSYIGGRRLPDDPEICYCLDVLGKQYEAAYGHPTQVPVQPVKLADVDEQDVLLAGPGHQQINLGWPCRVYKEGGVLGVMGVAVFQPLNCDERGYVVGFFR